MLSIIRRSSSIICTALKSNFAKKEFSFARISPATLQKTNYLQNQSPNLQIVRHKKDKAKGKKSHLRTDSEADSDDDDEDFRDEADGINAKLLNVNVSSLRADSIIKAGLGLARNKVDALFYDSKIRVNGKKLLKKSNLVGVGDEIDVVRGPSATNPDFITVSRVEVLSESIKGTGFVVKLRRYKSLIVEDGDKS